ncbi:hypothetical protein AB0P15_36750 [Streptomyces sp. NPDC087917]|uniref:DUF3885 domain-containing protein n=1 Tax=Streptomyces sp. NPDC087917 TaxID=3155060 RepID=UPI00343C03DB
MLDHEAMSEILPRQDLSLEALSALWEQRWPAPPGDLQMRYAYPDRWVRFHSLPESKRYPDSDAEYAVMLDRHHTLLDELGPNEAELYVLTREWNGDAEPTVRMPQLRQVDPDARHWGSHIHDDDFPDDILYQHEYISLHPRSRHALDPLLRLVADDVIAGVTLAPLDLRWLYHPYDGGGDVFAPSTSVRDALKAAHPEWLSTHPTGM